MEDFIFLEKKFNQNGKGKIEGFVEKLPFSKIPVKSRKKQIKGVGVDRLSLQDIMEEVPLYEQ